MEKLKVIVLLIGSIFMVSSCNKDSVNANKTIKVRLTDAPADYNAIHIDIQSVEIVGDNDKNVSLNVNNGVYNLLDFTNGKDTLIATGSLNTVNVKQIRLILGPNNTIVVDGTTYPLSTPSAEQSGLKLQINRALEAGVDNILKIDFDARASIVEQGNGVYKLKPVLKLVEPGL
jgi:hypothetical protein